MNEGQVEFLDSTGVPFAEIIRAVCRFHACDNAEKAPGSTLDSVDHGPLDSLMLDTHHR
jgi:hypothetical protein